MVKTSTLIAIAISTTAVMSVLLYKEHRANIIHEHNREIHVLVNRSMLVTIERQNLRKIQLIESDRIEQLTKSNRNELLCLSKAVFYEASNEPVKGKIAVAQVVVQRANHPSYPDNICDVVYQKTNSTCQFSWHCNPNIHRTKPTNGPLWEESKRIANQVLVDQVRLPNLTGALFFKATHVPTTGFWSKLTVAAQYGGHVFYKR